MPRRRRATSEPLGGMGLTAYAGPPGGRGPACRRRRLGLRGGGRGRQPRRADRQAARPHGDRQRRLGREGRLPARRARLDAAFNYRSVPWPSCCARRARRHRRVLRQRRRRPPRGGSRGAAPRRPRGAVRGDLGLRADRRGRGPRNLFLATAKDLTLRGFRGSSQRAPDGGDAARAGRVAPRRAAAPPRDGGRRARRARPRR